MRPTATTLRHHPITSQAHRFWPSEQRRLARTALMLHLRDAAGVGRVPKEVLVAEILPRALVTAPGGKRRNGRPIASGASAIWAAHRGAEAWGACQRLGHLGGSPPLGCCAMHSGGAATLLATAARGPWGRRRLAAELGRARGAKRRARRRDACTLRADAEARSDCVLPAL